MEEDKVKMDPAAGKGELDSQVWGRASSEQDQDGREGEMGGPGADDNCLVGLVEAEVVVVVEKSEEELMTLARDSTNLSLRNEWLLKLELERTKSAEEARTARREAWRKEVAERMEFRKGVVPDTVLLPEEWERVLRNVECSRDKAVLSRMSMMWWELQENERTSFLFQEVFQLLHQHDLLTPKEMTDCRVVSSHWRNSVEDYLQLQSNFKNEDMALASETVPEVRLPLLRTHFPPVYDATNWGKVIQFNVWCAQRYPGPNPFPSRKLCVGLASPVFTRFYNTPGFWAGVEVLLRNWGRELWDLDISIDKGTDMAAFYLEICKFAGLTPNLKFLRITDNGRNYMDEENAIIEKSERKSLERKMGVHPLPEMPNLKIINASFVPAPIIRALLTKYGPTLESVSITENVNYIEEWLDRSSIPNLKHFLYTCKEPVPVIPAKITVDWPSLEEIGWKCSIRFRFRMGTDGEVVRNVFQNINNLEVGGTCRQLTLHLEKDPDDGAIAKLEPSLLKVLTLELPQVERFTLTVYRVNLNTLDFILPMKTLKELDVTYVKLVSSFEKKKSCKKGTTSKSTPGGTEPASEDELIHFSNYVNRLYESNIWKLFPNLRKTTINIVIKQKIKSSYTEFVEVKHEKQTKQRVYTRQGYEAHCQGQEGQPGPNQGEGSGCTD